MLTEQEIKLLARELVAVSARFSRSSDPPTTLPQDRHDRGRGACCLQCGDVGAGWTMRRRDGQATTSLTPLTSRCSLRPCADQSCRSAPNAKEATDSPCPTSKPTVDTVSTHGSLRPVFVRRSWRHRPSTKLGCGRRKLHASSAIGLPPKPRKPRMRNDGDGMQVAGSSATTSLTSRR